MAKFQNMCYLLFSAKVLGTIISFSVCVLADDLDNFSFNNGRLINDFFYENQDLSALQVDDWEDEESTVEDKQAHVRTALLNALKDGKQLRRFAEVLPIIRVMSSPQRIALAALVSAQIAHEKEGTEGNGLSLPQVRRMFGDDPELILPVTLDIANLIRDTTRARGRSIASEHEFVPNAQALRRMLELPHKDNNEDDDEDEDEHIGEVLVTSGDDRDLSNEVILGNSTNIRDNFRDFKPQFDDSLTMRKNATERPKPIKLAKDQLAMPSDDMHMVVALLPSNETLTSFNGTNEDLPQAEQLRWHKRPIPFKPNHFRRPGLSHIANDLLNSDQKALNCFSRSLCLSTDDYPMDSIKASIRRNKNAMAALIVEYRDKDDEIQNIDLSDKPDLDRLGEEGTNSVPGTMCPSIVRYARPQKARSATGHWKYVVNTGEHTQTLRLEKCSRPNEPCTYLTDNFKSRCVQVYNYHRLLSWDANRGLHVDIFKIPTCCSCHIDDYKIAYPPVSPQKETTREVFPGKDYSNEADEYQDDHLGEDTQLYERDVNQFHFSPTNTNKKYNKNNLGTRGLDTKHRPTLIRDSEFESMMEDPETTTQTYNMISMYPVSTGRRKPTKIKVCPAF
ncbi:neurotrophin 1 [Ctenocephalides felis]|uniref:neurotrophin 1 n=1 Tax=Ctenocephalides felis TaxID=7515 RepID=UPI000E6E1CDB|nr:neurotrophin 1 [Ctenocephalides felis]